MLKKIKQEPLLHTSITDILPKDHKFNNKCVYCDKCREMLHAFNNECMKNWVETGLGNFCLMPCFIYKMGELDEMGDIRDLGI